MANVREDEFFSEALGIGSVPSPETLRKRLDERTEEFLAGVSEAAIAFLANVQAPCTPVRTGHVPLDADVTPFDNSQTMKEGVSRTCKGYDGYAPIAAYLGQEGWCLGFELRHGKQHC